MAKPLAVRIAATVAGPPRFPRTGITVLALPRRDPCSTCAYSLGAPVQDRQPSRVWRSAWSSTLTRQTGQLLGHDGLLTMSAPASSYSTGINAGSSSATQGIELFPADSGLSSRFVRRGIGAIRFVGDFAQRVPELPVGPRSGRARVESNPTVTTQGYH